MLHSALPRAAYLPSSAPALAYHHPHHLLVSSSCSSSSSSSSSSYFEESHQNPYAYLHHPAATRLADEAYAQRVFTAAWEQQQQQQRARTPCPLDLSLKTTASSISSQHDEDEVVVDDEEEDRRSSNRYTLLAAGADCEDVVVDDGDSQRSCSAHHQPQPFERTPKKIDLMGGGAASFFADQRKLAYPATPPPPHAPMTPPSTPSPPQPCHKRKDSGSTPSAPASGKPTRAKKKHVRKLKFDEETSSPVSGTVILGPDEAIVTGDIDPAFNIVEVTEEARAELAKIENRLGPYQCKLCRHLHEDAFQLARHRCSRIAHVEYRCPECDKRFSCPANLASHRRWHKPRPEAGEFACTRCDAKFAKNAALKKHAQQQHANDEQNNNNNNSSSSSKVEDGAKKRLAEGAEEMDLA